MGFILDLIIIAIVVLCVILAAKKGFVKSVFNIAGFVAAIVLSITFSGPISDFMYEKTVEPVVIKAVEGMVTDSEKLVSEEVFENLPDFIKNTAERFNINEESLHVVGDSSAVAQKISNDVVKPVAYSVLKAIISIVLIIVLSILFKFLARLLNKIFSFSIVGTLNRTLGGVLGLVQGLTIVTIFVLAVNIVISFTGGFLFFTNESVEASNIFKEIASFLQ